MLCCAKKKKKTQSRMPPQQRYQLQLFSQDGLFYDKNMKIVTEFDKVTLANDFHPECKFYCPICFRYFDRVLSVTCCSNYVCHLCAIQSIKNKLLNCHYCRNTQHKYVDVDTTLQLKKYCDDRTDV